MKVEKTADEYLPNVLFKHVEWTCPNQQPCWMSNHVRKSMPRFKIQWIQNHKKILFLIRKYFNKVSDLICNNLNKCVWLNYALFKSNGVSSYTRTSCVTFPTLGTHKNIVCGTRGTESAGDPKCFKGKEVYQKFGFYS